MAKKISEKELKKLTREEYHVTQEGGTEAPFTGALLKEKRSGKYVCKVCGNIIFDSKTKFDSGTGWPSFYDAKKGSVVLKKDISLGIPRTEVTCARCGSHLGHMFKDVPQTPTGKRYCINSAALNFAARKENGK